MTLDEQLYNGSRAMEVLENEQFKAAFEAIEKDLIRTWMQSAQCDAVGREKTFMFLNLLKKVQTHLTVTIETGKLAKLELNHKRTLSEKAKEWLS